LVGKPEGKRPFGTSRHSWDDNIRMDLKGTDWEGVDWIDLAQGTDKWQDFVNAVMNYWIL
jgi:hypothetical protein